eukprot:15436855-Alexandrium_andersonii.AAC.1
MTGLERIASAFRLAELRIRASASLSQDLLPRANFRDIDTSKHRNALQLRSSKCRQLTHRLQ